MLASYIIAGGFIDSVHKPTTCTSPLAIATHNTTKNDKDHSTESNHSTPPSTRFHAPSPESSSSSTPKSNPSIHTSDLKTSILSSTFAALVNSPIKEVDQGYGAGLPFGGDTERFPAFDINVQPEGMELGELNSQPHCAACCRVPICQQLRRKWKRGVERGVGNPVVVVCEESAWCLEQKAMAEREKEGQDRKRKRREEKRVKWESGWELGWNRKMQV